MARWTEAEMDWARHGLRLKMDRLNNPVRLSKTEIVQLRWEVETRQAVLNFVSTGFPMPKKLEPMAFYMVAMAVYHIRWYAGRMSAKGFQMCARMARQRMWDAYRHLASLPETGAGEAIRRAG